MCGSRQRVFTPIHPNKNFPCKTHTCWKCWLCKVCGSCQYVFTPIHPNKNFPCKTHRHKSLKLTHLLKIMITQDVWLSPVQCQPCSPLQNFPSKTHRISMVDFCYMRFFMFKMHTHTHTHTHLSPCNIHTNKWLKSMLIWHLFTKHVKMFGVRPFFKGTKQQLGSNKCTYPVVTVSCWMCLCVWILF